MIHAHLLHLGLILAPQVRNSRSWISAGPCFPPSLSLFYYHGLRAAEQVPSRNEDSKQWCAKNYLLYETKYWLIKSSVSYLQRARSAPVNCCTRIINWTFGKLLFGCALLTLLHLINYIFFQSLKFLKTNKCKFYIIIHIEFLPVKLVCVYQMKIAVKIEIRIVHLRFIPIYTAPKKKKIHVTSISVKINHE